MTETSQTAPYLSKDAKIILSDVDLRKTRRWRNKKPKFWSRRKELERIARIGRKMQLVRRRSYTGDVLCGGFFADGTVRASALTDRGNTPSVSTYIQWSFFNARPGASLLRDSCMSYSRRIRPCRRPVDYRSYEFYPRQESVFVGKLHGSSKKSSLNRNARFAGAMFDTTTRKRFFVFYHDYFHSHFFAQCMTWLDSNPYRQDVANTPLMPISMNQLRATTLAFCANSRECIAAGAFVGQWGEFVFDSESVRILPYMQDRLISAGFCDEIAVCYRKATLSSSMETINVWRLTDRAFDAAAHVDPAGAGPTWMEILHNRDIRRAIETALEIAAVERGPDITDSGRSMVNKAVNDMIGL